jgi:arylsulfatase A-like enzyme
MRLALAFAFFFAVVAGPVSAATVEKPNIVLIFADDLGASDLACYGSTFHRTPRLDELARNGVRFTQGYAASPVCSPTRAALNTGKCPARVGITDWLPGRPDQPSQRLNRPPLKQQLALEETTLAELLKARGYVTAHIGKWHLGGAGFLPQDQGYDLNIAGDDAGLPRNYFAPYEGSWNRGPRSFMRGLEQAPTGEYLTDRLGAEAAKFIAANAEKPFFLSLPHYGVHTPMRAPEELVKTYDPSGRPVGSQQNPIYAAMLESVDRSVGLIVDTLAKHGLTERTLVIFTSDNGGLSTLEGPNTPATSNAPLREGKGFLYEGGIRVPFIFSGYGVKDPGRTDDTPIWSCDVLPTAASLCGVEKLPANIDGVDLAPRLQDAAPLAARTLCWHYPHYPNQGARPGSAIRDGNWKLIEFFEFDRFELFDLAADPRESKNVAAANPEIVEKLAKQLDAWRKAVGALKPTLNPNYAPNQQAADGTITLTAKSADVHGSQLRFEAAPHKNTLGYWTNVTDFASWEFTVNKSGNYQVELLQGCGKGQGGSVVNVLTHINGIGSGSIGSLDMTVEDTGHFQNFVPRKIGEVYLSAGLNMLSLRAKTKAAAAVMDLRQIVLRPIVAKPAEK